jgi:hypothetical protein
MTSYQPFGPFVDGQPPGLSAEWCNNVENFLVTVTGGTPSVNSAATDTNISSDGNGNETVKSIIANYAKLTTGGSSINGSTSGSATLYQPERGTYKKVLVWCNNFRNGGASAQNLSIPVPFTTACVFRAFDVNTFSLLAGGSTQNIGIWNGWPSSGTAGGTYFTSTTSPGHAQGFCNHAIDTVQFTPVAASAHTGFIILEGV